MEEEKIIQLFAGYSGCSDEELKAAACFVRRQKTAFAAC